MYRVFQRVEDAYTYVTSTKTLDEAKYEAERRCDWLTVYEVWTDFLEGVYSKGKWRPPPLAWHLGMERMRDDTMTYHGVLHKSIF